MIKGINKILLTFVSALFILMPFSYSIYADETVIDWDTFGVPIERSGAYSYWFRYGLSNISYQNQQDVGNVITTTYGAHDFSITREGVIGNDYSTYYVYNSNGARMGKFIGFNPRTATANPHIVYLSSNNEQSICTNCYIGFETDENDIIKLTESQHTGTTEYRTNYVNRLQYVVPSLSGTYYHSGIYDYTNKCIVRSDSPYIISFMFDLRKSYTNPTLSFISDPSQDTTKISYNQINRNVFGNWDLRTYKLETTIHHVEFDFIVNELNNTNVNIIPVYQGNLNSIPADLYPFCMGNKYIYETHDNELISIMRDGNQGSQLAVNDADSTNNDFQNANNTFDDLEADFSTNMNNSLNAIDTNLNVNNLSGFVYGANWVKTQFDYMINNFEPIELLVTYSLILGLAMLLIGKRLL